MDYIEKAGTGGLFEHHTENALIYDRIYARNSVRKLYQFFNSEVIAWLWGKQFVTLDHKEYLHYLQDTRSRQYLQGDTITFPAFHKQMLFYQETCGFPTLPKGA